jgi:hypothetical protein
MQVGSQLASLDARLGRWRRTAEQIGREGGAELDQLAQCDPY